MQIGKRGLPLFILACTLGTQAAVAAERSLILTGTCDGSAAAWIDQDSFVNANDEDPMLRVYSATDGKQISDRAVDIAKHLGIGPNDEPDIEGAARVGNRIYWITSHALDSDGVIRPERHRLFAMDIVSENGKPKLVPAGRAYFGLLKAISKAAEMKKDAKKPPELAALDLPAAAKHTPEETADGLNIEGLAEGPNGELWIGFRGPIGRAGKYAGKALILPLLNPAAVIDAAKPMNAEFGAPIAVDLGGRGIRDITRVGKDYLILGGPFGPEEPPAFALYRWSGASGANAEKLAMQFPQMRPEALSATASNLLILSDDGDEKPTGAKKCKNLIADDKRFKARVVPLSELR